MRSMSQAHPANHPVIAIPIASIHKPTMTLCLKGIGPSFTLNWKILQRRRWAGSALRDATA
jgi:hypothetical protein